MFPSLLQPHQPTDPHHPSKMNAAPTTNSITRRTFLFAAAPDPTRAQDIPSIPTETAPSSSTVPHYLGLCHYHRHNET